MNRPALLFHHTHTPDSNRFEREVRGVRIESHVVNYVEITRRLPSGVDAVYVKTDHWKTNPEYFEGLERRLGSIGADLDRFETHVALELDGSRAVVVNGVEASVREQKHHVTICGLPLDDAATYHNLTVAELRRDAKRAAWIAPAHVGMPFHYIPGQLLQSICSLSNDPDINVALGYTTGYFPLYNRISRNELPSRTSVREYARQYDIPLLPELDLHGFVPAQYAGCGVLSSEAVSTLEIGTLPVAGILGADLFSPEGYKEGIAVSEFIKNYASFVPFISSDINYRAAFRQSIPETGDVQAVDIQSETVSLP